MRCAPKKLINYFQPLQTDEYDFKDYNVPNLTSRKSPSNDDKNTCGVDTLTLRSNLQTCIMTITSLIIISLH